MKSWTRRISPTLILAGVTLAACQDDDGLTPPDPQLSEGRVQERVERARQIAKEELQKSVQGDDSRLIENHILRMEAEVPSIGGFYYDSERERMVIIGTDQTHRDRAIAAANKHHMEPARLAAPGSKFAESPVEFELGEYSFSTLVGWHTLLAPFLISEVPEFVSIGANERLNRVEITIDRESGRSKVAAVLKANGVPSEAVRLRQRPRPHFDVGYPDGTTYLTATAGVREDGHLQQASTNMGAGLQIERSDGVRCSLGFTARIPHSGGGATWGYLTAAHCNPPIGSGSTGAEMYQPVSGAKNFGWVWRNRRYNYSPPCQDGGTETDRCTRADALMIATHKYVEIEKRLALSPSRGDNTPGIYLTYDWHPNIADYSAPAIGQNVWKTGRTSGTTRGQITETYETIGICELPRNPCPSSLWVVIEGAARTQGASSGGGDSGGPTYQIEFAPNGVNWIVPLGIHFAGSGTHYNGNGACIANCETFYSPLPRVRAHLRFSELDVSNFSP